MRWSRWKTFNRSEKLILHINSCGEIAISEARIGTKTKSVDSTKSLHSGFSVLKESLKDEILVKLISKHKDTQQAKEQSYSCSFCPKTFSNNSHLIRRIKTHVLTDSFECDDCEERFSRQFNLQTHMRNHHLKTFDDVNTIHFKQKLKK